MRLLPTRSRLLQPQRGQAIVELALLATGLMGLFVIVFDFARVLVIYLIVANAAREGARIAAIGGATYNTAASACSTTTTNEVKNAAYCGSQNISPWITPQVLTITCKTATYSGSPTRVYTSTATDCPSSITAGTATAVKVSTVFSPAFPFIRLATGSYTQGNPISVSSTVYGFAMYIP